MHVIPPSQWFDSLRFLTTISSTSFCAANVLRLAFHCLSIDPSACHRRSYFYLRVASSSSRWPADQRITITSHQHERRSATRTDHMYMCQCTPYAYHNSFVERVLACHRDTPERSQPSDKRGQVNTITLKATHALDVDSASICVVLSARAIIIHLLFCHL